MWRTMHVKILREAHPTLRHQSKEVLDSVLESGTIRSFKRWEPIIKKGTPVTHLMMLDQGVCVEEDDERTAATCSGVDGVDVTCREHSRPGDTLQTEDYVDQRAPMPHTLVAIGECS